MHQLNEIDASVSEQDSWKDMSQLAQPSSNMDGDKIEKVCKIEFGYNLTYEQTKLLDREDIKSYMAPVHFPSVDPRLL